MKKTMMIAALALWACGSMQAQNDVARPILKSNIKLKTDRMTPEALWAMGRISSYAASPDGKHIVYQVGYYSVKENKSHHVLYMMNADGTGQQLLTQGSKNETDAAWLSADKLAFISGGEIWTMRLDGTNRQQATNTDGAVEGFKFSPDQSKVIILKSMPFHEIIKANPSDLPKATGRRVTDLMYRHWDHYVESIMHPFVADVNHDGDRLSVAKEMTDILVGRK